MAGIGIAKRGLGMFIIEAFEKRLIINPLDNSNYYNLKKFKEINLK